MKDLEAQLVAELLELDADAYVHGSLEITVPAHSTGYRITVDLDDEGEQLGTVVGTPFMLAAMSNALHRYTVETQKQRAQTMAELAANEAGRALLVDAAVLAAQVEAEENYRETTEGFRP
ncbi:hypothetical protein [Protaetiibacter larvae]|uniref:Uncharacterized protein n=1 Tax=Protaetiibacter larvae TaxID=2592654 RepID=A0A5C1Y543_9MICO|nr:hypothetical protein [Protaetiibacter larvae]QEO08896.1 hypothetical protein FLP23_01975 [Protaetiibacter larvae]